MTKLVNSDNLSRPQSSEHYLKVRRNLANENADVTIIIQAYGNLMKTRTCIENIFKYTSHDFELVLLDNGTPENDVLEYFESINYENKTVIRMTKNITGVYAMDKILHGLECKYLVIIPNDVIVTQNWLENLLVCAESDESIGMVSAVSTNVSNLQTETLGGFSCIEEMQMKASAFNVSDPSKWEERIRMIPTATLYRREIFDVVGVYDLGFMHDFGDDDFSFRVRRAGYKLMVCRDTFVHHDHDQKALPQERMDILKQSRDFFKEKYHGVDAWDDTCNFILDSLKTVAFENTEKKDILALDVKCGTPILDVKNHLRKNHIEVASCKAYTTDAKYLIDLQGMSDEVVCGDVEQTINCEHGKYDVIVLGKPLNCYNKPFELITKLAYLKKDGGFIIFSIKNTHSIVSILKIMGGNIQVENLYPREMHYNDVFTELTKYGIKTGELNCKAYNIEQATLDRVLNGFKAMDMGIKTEDILMQLQVDEYMITVS